MCTIDIILSICFIAALIHGIVSGFISQAFSILSLILGSWLAFQFSKTLCGYIIEYLPGVSPAILNVISFIIILTVVLVLFSLLGKVLSKAVKFAMLGWLDKLLGAILSLVKATLIIALLIILFTTLNSQFHFVPEEALAKSTYFNPLKDFSYTAFPYLKALIFKN